LLLVAIEPSVRWNSGFELRNGRSEARIARDQHLEVAAENIRASKCSAKSDFVKRPRGRECPIGQHAVHGVAEADQSAWRCAETLSLIRLVPN
jgi:hypothetical protein